MHRFALIFGWVFAGACAMSQAFAADADGCKDPGWAAARMAGYEISSCEKHDFAKLDLDLVKGAQTVGGKQMDVTYTLKDGAPDHKAAEVRKFYVDAATKSGATLESSPGDGYNATLHRKTPQGEQWIVYSHGSGNEDSTGSYTVTTLDVAAMSQEVIAQAVTAPMTGGKSCANPPWLKKQFDYFKLSECSYLDLNAFTVDLPSGKKTFAGRYMANTYTLTDDKKNPTALVVKNNYVAALQKIGAKLVSDPNDVFNAVLTQKTPVGDMWYLYTHGSGSQDSTTSYDLITAEVGGPAPKTCTLEVYGVNFDFNKATLRPDSEPVLQQVLALFKSDPNYSGEIGGHTDNVGKPDYNMKLSGERADAVKAWLVSHGVDAKRLTTHGYGDTKPLVPNTTDANRFKNRRVELKRNNCQ